MSDMVERVARKLAERCGVDPDSKGGGSWDGGSLPYGEPAWTVWEDDARVAVEEMRDISPDAVARAADRLGIAPSDVTRLVGTWSILIDEALA
jgi:hypothetical protein